MKDRMSYDRLNNSGKYEVEKIARRYGLNVESKGDTVTLSGNSYDLDRARRDLKSYQNGDGRGILPDFENYKTRGSSWGWW